MNLYSMWWDNSPFVDALLQKCIIYIYIWIYKLYYLVQNSDVFKLLRSFINENKSISFFFRLGTGSSKVKLKLSNLLKYT